MKNMGPSLDFRSVSKCVYESGAASCLLALVS
jgi:hypothetical protein